MGQDALSQLKGDIFEWMKSCEVIVTDMKQQFQPMANMISNLSKEVQTLKGEFKMLKQECSKVKLSTCNRQASDTGNAKNVQAKNDPVLVGLTQLREENKIAFEFRGKYLWFDGSITSKVLHLHKWLNTYDFFSMRFQNNKIL